MMANPAFYDEPARSWGGHFVCHDIFVTFFDSLFSALWFGGLGFLVFEPCELTVDGDKRGFSETCEWGTRMGRDGGWGDLMLASM